MDSFIEILNRWGDHFLNFAWPMLWQSSVLIVALFAIDFALRKKIRAAIRYSLWLVVLVKLILPPTLASPTNPHWWIHAPTPLATKTIPFTVTYGNTVAPPDFQMSQNEIPKPPPPHLSHTVYILISAIIVSVSLFAWLLLRWRRVTQIIHGAKISDEFKSLLAEVRQLAGLRSTVRLKLTEDSMSPAVCGLFRPVILLPQSLAKNLSREQLRAVLLHEAIHLRRGDVWMNCAQALLQIIYWWHPLLWLANARIRRVREEAVDDKVMLTLRDGAEIYAPTLLEVAKFAFRRPLATLGLVGILESSSALRQRIERLMDFRAPRKAGLTVISVLGILAFTAVAVPMGEAPEKTNSEIIPPQNQFSAPENKIEAGQLVQDGKIFYEVGRFDDAELDINAALKLDPDNEAAKYYLNLIGQSRLALKSGGIKAVFPIITNISGISLMKTSQNRSGPSSNLLTTADIVKQMNRISIAKTHEQPTNLEMRVFSVDAFFAATLRNISDLPSGNVSAKAGNLFSKLGVDLTAPGRSIAFNDKFGLLFVKATASELDTVERAIIALNSVDPQIHIKARFVEVPKSFVVPESFSNVAANPMIGILSDTNFRAILHILQQQKNAETIAEPEVVTISGRQTQMRATQTKEILLANASNHTSILPQTEKFQIGPTIDLVPNILADDYTIDLKAIPAMLTYVGDEKTDPPVFRLQETDVHIKMWDNQTLILGNLENHFVGFTNGASRTIDPKYVDEAERKSLFANKKLLIFVTATIVDPAGNRVHSDDELSKLSAIPLQPQMQK